MRVGAALLLLALSPQCIAAARLPAEAWVHLLLQHHLAGPVGASMRMQLALHSDDLLLQIRLSLKTQQCRRKRNDHFLNTNQSAVKLCWERCRRVFRLRMLNAPMLLCRAYACVSASVEQVIDDFQLCSSCVCSSPADAAN